MINTRLPTSQNTVRHGLCALTILFLCVVKGCGSASSPLNEPTRYKTMSALKSRLLEVSQYGDGGSSLGGIPESIDELMKADPAKGKKLLADFQRLNMADSKETRKQIAKEMADQID